MTREDILNSVEYWKETTEILKNQLDQEYEYEETDHYKDSIEDAIKVIEERLDSGWMITQMDTHAGHSIDHVWYCRQVEKLDTIDKENELKEIIKATKDLLRKVENFSKGFSYSYENSKYLLPQNRTHNLTFNVETALRNSLNCLNGLLNIFIKEIEYKEVWVDVGNFNNLETDGWKVEKILDSCNREMKILLSRKQK